MMQKDVIRLYTEGVRSITVYFGGGEDSGGIHEVFVDIPKDFTLKDNDRKCIREIANDIIYENWSSFTGTPYVEGTVVLEPKLTGNLDYEFELMIDMSAYDVDWDKDGNQIDGTRNNFEEQYGDYKLDKHQIHSGTWQCEFNDDDEGCEMLV